MEGGIDGQNNGWIVGEMDGGLMDGCTEEWIMDENGRWMDGGY